MARRYVDANPTVDDNQGNDEVDAIQAEDIWINTVEAYEGEVYIYIYM